MSWMRCNYCGHCWGPIHLAIHWPAHLSDGVAERWYPDRSENDEKEAENVE